MRFVKTAESIWNIPSGFTRIEYLESTGTQYIDMGIGVKENTVFKATFSVASAATGRGYFGARNSSNERFQIVNSIGIGAGYYIATSVYPIVNKKYEIEMHANGDMYLDGVKRNATNGTFSQVSFERNLWLFATNYYNSSVGPGASTFWKAQVFDGDVLVRDMIPCIDPLGRACMYDLVGKKTYYNQGTGEFTVGRQIIPVNYLESTGTQYIDTDITLTSNHSVEVDYQLTSASQNRKGIFGGLVTSGPRFGALLSPSNNYLEFGYGSGNEYYQPGLPDTQRHIMKQQKNLLYFDGVLAHTFSTATFTQNFTAPLGNFTYTNYNPASAKYYSSKWWDGETLVRDFIPCKDENNVGFMFDSVSGTVYENAGMGAFTVGQNKYKMKLRLIKDNILPTGYTQVEYLQSTGTQYIDTGVIPNENTSLTISITPTGIDSTFGGVLSSRVSPNIDVIGFGMSNSYTSANFGSGTEIQISRFYNNENYIISEDKSGIVVNGTKTTFSGTHTYEFASKLKMPIFARNNNGSIGSFFIGKVLYCQIYDNNTLVRNFIPAIDPSGTPCMYDLVSRTPFYNDGTGTFTTGKPVLPIVRFPVDPVPVGYKTVNYLGSDSTAYIDTGVSGGNTNLKISMKYLYTNHVQYACFYGNYVDDNHLETRGILDVTSRPNNFVSNLNSNNNFDENIIANNNTKNVWHTLTCYDGVIKLDNVTFTGTQTRTNSTNNDNLVIFNRSATNPYTGRDIGLKIAYFQIYDNNTLVRNFIPVVRLLDNKSGMWDTVTKQFYTTPVGDFITG